ncbi:GNAT family N-acetyltransferase [Shewanella colwelliana]|uniref:GNAT family N-acetyltransferase n=1 Tax=Shewanella colwelliana TaxID=23 RepID=UPI0022B010D8|nr:GNAT family N-acetyltransferase [Shewanella colwelliana]MCZ4338367.1 GNAT family N-acetyltransferase [Shewanella colwelliana]
MLGVVKTTPRLILREFSLQDAEGFYRLNLDSHVLRYTGDESFDSIEAAARFIENYDEYKRHGFGRWSVIERATGRYLGFCGLRKDTLSGEVDLGFRLMRSVWRQGFAAEAAQAALQVGIKDYKISTFYGNVMRENEASIQLLKKLKFELLGAEQQAPSEWLKFVLYQSI